MSPKTLGRFEVINMLGRGAMGCVFLAHDPRIDRRVAIKTLEGLEELPSEARELTRARFLREAQAAGRLSHPNIVTIFDVGEEAGTPYIAMEFLDGISLSAYTSAPNLLPLADVISIVDQACDALHYAHSAGIVHRDIKPANMMVLPGGTLKIADFGLAQRPETNLTTEGMLVETPYYMAPEQIRGAGVDARSDLFSLGVVFYQLLTGALPFPGDSIHSVIHRIMSEPPAEFPAGAAVPEPLRDLIRRAIEKDPTTRPATGDSFRRALRTAAMAAKIPARSLTSLGGEPSQAPLGARALPDRAAAETVRAGRERRSRAALPKEREGSARARHGRGKALVGAATVGATLLVAAGAAYYLLVPGPALERTGRRVAAAQASPPELADTGPTIHIVTDPSANLFLDGKPLSGPSFRLVRGDTARHRVRAESGCRSAETEISASAATGEVRLVLAREQVRFPVASTPAGARVSVNGKSVRGETPLTIEIDRCLDNRVDVTLEGYRALEYRLAAGAPVVSLASALSSVAFRTQEPGSLRVVKGPYEGKVFVDGRLVGAAGGLYTVPAGKRRVAFVSDPLFVRIEGQLAIAPGDERVWKPAWPSLGALTVQATPTNCGIEIRPRNESSYRYVDDVPIVRYRLAAGFYTVRCTLRTSSKVQERDVEVLPGATAQIDFTFL